MQSNAILFLFIHLNHWNSQLFAGDGCFCYFIDCNYAKGKWIQDDKRPLYSGNECKQWLSKMWACRMMRRAHFSYENYRWQPHGCEMPEFTGPNFLKRYSTSFICAPY